MYNPLLIRMLGDFFKVLTENSKLKVKMFNFAGGRKDKQTYDENMWSEKRTWAVRSGELKCGNA